MLARAGYALALGALAMLLAAQGSSAEPPPATLYTMNCWGCHGARGQGVPGRVPRLAGSAGYFTRLPEGRAYLVEVPGVAESPLSDGQVAEVLNWVLETFSREELVRGFVPYTEAEVAQDRKRQLSAVEAVRTALVKRLQLSAHRGPLPIASAP